MLTKAIRANELYMGLEAKAYEDCRAHLEGTDYSNGWNYV